ncbi:MAG: pitrilysin family protein [Dehalococcoidia bacterium]
MHHMTTLPNGLRILTESMPHTRSVSVSFYVGAGSRYETAPVSGLSHFVEHMLFKGSSKRRTAKAISEAVDRVGGNLNGGTDRELTVYYVKVARPHFELAFDILVDMLRRPLMDEAEVEKERKVIIEELASVGDSPAQQADILLDGVMWPDQPLGWDVAGNDQFVSSINHATLLDYFDRQYRPNNIVLSIAGAVRHDDVALAERELGDWAPGSPSSWFAATDGHCGARAKLLYKKTEQAHISLAVLGVANDHPDRYAIDLLSAILGEGMSSRLFMELRENRSLCYDVHSYTSHFLDTGAFSVYAGVDPKQTGEAVTAILEQLAAARDGAPEDELVKAKELTKGRLLLRMEDTRSVSGWLGVQELLTGRVRTVEDVVAQIEAVTSDDLRRVANDLFKTDKLAMAIVGPHRGEKRFLPLLKL